MMDDIYDAADDQEAAHHNDQLAIQRDIAEVIEKASVALDDGDINLLCWATGVDRRQVQPRRFRR